MLFFKSKCKHTTFKVWRTYWKTEKNMIEQVEYDEKKSIVYIYEFICMEQSWYIYGLR